MEWLASMAKTTRTTSSSSGVSTRMPGASPTRSSSRSCSECTRKVSNWPCNHYTPSTTLKRHVWWKHSVSTKAWVKTGYKTILKCLLSLGKTRSSKDTTWTHTKKSSFSRAHSSSIWRGQSTANAFEYHWSSLKPRFKQVTSSFSHTGLLAQPWVNCFWGVSTTTLAWCSSILRVGISKFSKV